MRIPELRLRAPTADLLALPWGLPLSEWTIPDVPLRDIAVGPSRHLVKFVEADGKLWAVKELPRHIADKEYGVLRRLEDMGLPAVRPAGLVRQPEFDTALLLTRYLTGSWPVRYGGLGWSDDSAAAAYEELMAYEVPLPLYAPPILMIGLCTPLLRRVIDSLGKEVVA